MATETFAKRDIDIKVGIGSGEIETIEYEIKEFDGQYFILRMIDGVETMCSDIADTPERAVASFYTRMGVVMV